MPDDINSFLQKVSSIERSSGMMTAYLSMSKEDQLKLLEWARTACLRLANYLEKQSMIILSGTNEHIDLPVPKIFADIALKVGIIHGTIRNLPDLIQGCVNIYRHVFGENKLKVIEDFRDTALLTVQVSKW